MNAEEKRQWRLLVTPWMVSCSACGQKVPYAEDTCPYCGHTLRKVKTKALNDSIIAHLPPMNVNCQDGIERLMRRLWGEDYIRHVRDGDMPDAEVVNEGLEVLTARERYALIMRYGLDGKGVRTYPEIADLYLVDPERVRILVAKADRRLMAPRKLQLLTRRHNGTKVAGT